MTLGRLEALDAATRAIAGVLDVDTVLQLIADSVRELVNAEYAALGVVDATGRIERFITSWISREGREQIGELPQGHGLLGSIIRAGRSYRIADISKHPDSYGFPANHPSMVSFLGVPVIVAGGSVGNLYLTNKLAAAEFSEGEQRLVEMFALHAGIAIERARLHAQVQQLAELARLNGRGAVPRWPTGTDRANGRGPSAHRTRLMSGSQMTPRRLGHRWDWPEVTFEAGHSALPGPREARHAGLNDSHRRFVRRKT